MFRRIVLLTWTEDATQEQRAAVATELGKLPTIITELRRFDVGVNTGAGPEDADLGIIADFDSVDHWVAYRDHPAHQAVVADYIKPILAARTSVQYEF